MNCAPYGQRVRRPRERAPIDRTDNVARMLLLLLLPFWATLPPSLSHTQKQTTLIDYLNVCGAIVVHSVRPQCERVPDARCPIPSPTTLPSRSLHSLCLPPTTRHRHVHLCACVCASHCGIYCLPFVSKVLWHWGMN